MSSNPDYNTDASEMTDQELITNIQALVKAHIVSCGRDELEALHNYLKSGDVE